MLQMLPVHADLVLLRNDLLDRLRYDLMIVLLLQATHDNNCNDTLNTSDANRVSTTVDSVLIRNSAAVGTSNSVLLHKRSLDLVRRSASAQSAHGLLSHRPTGQSPAEYGVPLATHPVLVIRDCAALRRGLEYHVWWEATGCRGGERN